MTDKITLTFPDNSKREFAKGTTALEVAKSIGQRLADAAIAAKLDQDLIDLNFKIEKSARFQIFTFDSKEGKEVFWHSTAHLLAHAVIELFPEAKLTIGPAVEEGFYYDIDHAPFTPQDIAKIEEKMRMLVKENIPISRMEMTKAEAKKMFKNNPYKLEMIGEMEGTVSAYTQGTFVDMCRGPHVPSTGKIKSLKLTKVAGAYWRGDEKNKQLQRIYGISFPDKLLLADYLHMIEEAMKRDHRKLAKDLKLFMISDEVGKGLPLWLPNGAFIRKKLEDYMYQKEFDYGYKYVYTPVLTHKKLYEISGHLAHYKEDMYNPITIEGEEYYLKPMNCPHHHQIFKYESMSYKDLPLRLAEFGLCHRFERSGVLTGLIRARCFTQNDSHIYCTKSQLKDELLNVLKLFKEVYTDFGLKDYWFRLSLPDFNNKEKFGDVENKAMWDEAGKMAEDALKSFGVKYEIGIGEASFYGPKIDVQIKNVLGKEDTIATSQVDFYSANKFDLNFINEKSEKEKVVIIHRAIMGSFDRFFSFLVEQYAGKFPLWLNPVQVIVLTLADRHNAYAEHVAAELKKKGIRAEADLRSESIPKKVRDAQLKQINYILVVGDSEEKNGTVNVRTRDNVVHGEKKIEVLAHELLKEIQDKK